jgi:hypothetical protein
MKRLKPAPHALERPPKSTRTPEPAPVSVGLSYVRGQCAGQDEDKLEIADKCPESPPYESGAV